MASDKMIEGDRTKKRCRQQTLLGPGREGKTLECVNEEGRRNGSVPFPATDGAAAAVFLLFLHLPEHGVFFDFDETPALLLAEAEPEIFYALALLGRAGAPNLIVARFGGVWIVRNALGWGPCLSWSGGVGRRGRWMGMGLLLLLLLLSLRVGERRL